MWPSLSEEVQEDNARTNSKFRKRVNVKRLNAYKNYRREREREKEPIHKNDSSLPYHTSLSVVHLLPGSANWFPILYFLRNRVVTLVSTSSTRQILMMRLFFFHTLPSRISTLFTLSRARERETYDSPRTFVSLNILV